MNAKTKTIMNISVVIFLIFAAASQCFAEIVIEDVSTKRAKELGVAIRAHKNGDAGVKVRLEFRTQGVLKDFNCVELIIRTNSQRGAKRLVSVPLLAERLAVGSVSAHFSAAASYLEVSELWIVVNDPPLGGTGYRFKVKDFLEAGFATGADHQPAQSGIQGGLAPAGMVLIPAGDFTMGDAMGDGDTRGTPRHTVSVSAFYMDKYEVTKQLWDGVYQWSITNGYAFDNAGLGKGTNHPVHTVNWFDVVKWCNARSEKEGKVPAYYTDAAMTGIYKTGQAAPHVRWDRGYRLPTEAEWEKAARGGLSGKRFPWGDSITHSNANYFSSADCAFDTSCTRGYHPIYNDGRMPYTSPVGSFAANGYGLYDMTGNVWEWCWDWYGAYGSANQTDPRGSDSDSYRVVRGGAFSIPAGDGRTAYRNSFSHPTGRQRSLGFRAVLPPDQP